MADKERRLLCGWKAITAYTGVIGRLLMFLRHYGDWTKMKRLPSAILMVIRRLEFLTK